MPTLLLLLDLPHETQMQYLRPLQAAFPQLTVQLVGHHSAALTYAAAADVLVTFAPMLSDEVLRAAEKVKWIQALGTGVDNLIDQPALRPEIMITNIHGIHGPAMSESAILSMLALSRDFPRIAKNQREQVWERWPARLLESKTVGILGMGAIAEALAPRCKALDMKVVGITSTKRSVAGFDQVFGKDQLRDAVATLDYLIVLTPYSPETRMMINAEIFSAMKPTAYFINLARGGVVDEGALIAALENGTIAGAALDVFHTEPLPPNHPLWSTKNLIITPHLGGFNDQYAAQAVRTVMENVRRFLAGDANLLNIVKR